MRPSRKEILSWLLESDEGRLRQLWRAADDARQMHVGRGVHLRGLVEISSHCRRSCHYCGLRAGNANLSRYRMTQEQVVECALQAQRLGFGTVVLQAGEDPLLSGAWVAEVVRRIKSQTPLAVTLSLGERGRDELEAWRQAGADRYLLRFETSNRRLYERIHPPAEGTAPVDRIEMLRLLRRLGYQTGGGVMVGIPGQSWEDLADDLEVFAELDLDMIGIGPFIPHPQTPLGQGTQPARADQAAADELTAYKMVALARLVCPRAHIPSTTALATLNRSSGRELGLSRGANVVMPNLTPVGYRALYEIYPDKACIHESGDDCNSCLRGRIGAIGREVASGPGHAVQSTIYD